MPPRFSSTRSRRRRRDDRVRVAVLVEVGDPERGALEGGRPKLLGEGGRARRRPTTRRGCAAAAGPSPSPGTRRAARRCRSPRTAPPRLPRPPATGFEREAAAPVARREARGRGRRPAGSPRSRPCSRRPWRRSASGPGAAARPSSPATSRKLPSRMLRKRRARSRVASEQVHVAAVVEVGRDHGERPGRPRRGPALFVMSVNVAVAVVLEQQARGEHVEVAVVVDVHEGGRAGGAARRPEAGGCGAVLEAPAARVAEQRQASERAPRAGRRGRRCR